MQKSKNETIKLTIYECSYDVMYKLNFIFMDYDSVWSHRHQYLFINFKILIYCQRLSDIKLINKQGDKNVN